MNNEQLTQRAAELKQQLAVLDKAMDKIHDEEKVVAHSEKMMVLQRELWAVQEQINRSN